MSLKNVLYSGPIKTFNGTLEIHIEERLTINNFVLNTIFRFFMLLRV